MPSMPDTSPSASTDPTGAPRREGRLRLKLAHKIPLLVVAAALVSGTVVAIADYRHAADELRGAAEARLSALLEARRVAIGDYLDSIRRDLRSQAENPFVIEAFNSFRVGWDEIGPQADVRLRGLYIDSNPFLPGSRQFLDHPNDPSIYSLAHNRFHPRLRDFVQQYGYRDLLMIGADGTVAYSVMKQRDFAASLGGAAPEDGLAEAFRNVMNDPRPDIEAFVDFRFYAPAGGGPAGFIAAPLQDETGTRIGVLAFEMPIDRINRVMQVAAGLGASGETFIVGGDLLMRSDSRFSRESTILTKRIETGPVSRALAGESGTAIDLRAGATDTRHLAAFAPLDFMGARWAIVAQADLVEVYAPIGRMRDQAIVNGLFLAVLVALAGYVATRLTVVRPMTGIAAAVSALTQGRREARIPSIARGDEIGDVARALVLFRSSLDERDRLAAEREQAAKAEAVRRRLAEAIEAISDGFILLDSEDRVVMVNSKYREIYRQSAHLLAPGESFETFLRHHAELGEIVEARGRVDAFVEDRMRRMLPGEAWESRLADGRWLLVTDFRTEDGGTVSICGDITDLKRREQALLNSEAQMRAIVNTAADAIMTLDAGGGIVDFNPAAEEIFARARQSMLGRTIGTLVPALEPFRQTQARHLEVEAIRGDGTGFPAELTIVEVPVKGRRMYTLFLRDLTEAKHAEQEIARQREALYQSEKLTALGSLLAGVAHELNNPLSIVVAQAVLMEETARDARTAKRAADIRAAAERCARIVKTFLAMARQQPPRRGPVNLSGLVEGALELLNYGLRTANIEVSVDLAGDLPAVWGDADQLHQVLANLIVNAQQAMLEHPGPRRLRIATARDDTSGMLRLTVDDSGPGVPVAQRSRIFDPFYTTKPTGVGTGVGLSVCHGVVESHGGHIAVEDAPGGGARFVVLLPAGVDGADQKAPGNVPASPRPAIRRILIVDDEPLISSTLQEILQVDGHRVDVAESGKAALALIANTRYDLVVTDLRMPDLDGPGLYDALRESHPGLARRMIVITGDTLNTGASAFLRDSGLRVIEKPFSPGDVTRAVAAALSGA